MSKEFEEIVLKKLDTLDERTKNTGRVIEERILKRLDGLEDTVRNVVLNKLDVLDERTKNTDRVIEEVIFKRLDGLEDTVQNVVLNKLDVLDERTKNTDKEVKVMQSDMKSIKENVEKLNNNFTVFDFEINKKIDTLFDAITANNEKHDIFEKSVVSLNTKTFNHDIRISVLEDYNKNAKIFATN